MKPFDHRGIVYGDWTAIEQVDPTPNKKQRWRCICKCGAEDIFFATHMIRGKIVKCNGMPNHAPVKSISSYTTYKSMLARCYLPNHIHYSRYGGRGITVCDEWKESFVNFYKDMGPRKDGYSIERVDNNGPYSPENCVWATHQQQQNNLRSNRHVMHDGKRYTIAELARLLGMKYETLYSQVVRREYLERQAANENM